MELPSLKDVEEGRLVVTPIDDDASACVACDFHIKTCCKNLCCMSKRDEGEYT